MAEMMGTRERCAHVQLRHLTGERPEGLDRGDEDVSVLPHPLVAAVREKQWLVADDRPVLLVTFFGTIRFTWPHSSSSSMNTIPFAVAGRWRAIARPAYATVDPCDEWCRSSLRSACSGRCGRSNVNGCTPTDRPVRR